MTEKIRAVLIDPANKTITEIEVMNDFPGPGAMYEVLNCETIEQFAAGGLKAYDVMLLDEEGTFVDNPDIFFFNGGQHEGRALIVGTKEEFVYSDLVTPLETIKKLVVFTD